MDQSFQSASRASNLIFAIIFVESLAIFAVVLRLIARRLARLPFAPDDWMIVIALVWLLQMLYGIVLLTTG